MEEVQPWDWKTELKEIPVKEWKTRFNWVEEFHITPDGESIASVVNVDEMAFDICVNGEVQERGYEKIWNLVPLPDNRFAAFVCNDDKWTLTVNGTEWSNRFDFVWNFHITPTGEHFGFAFQKDSEYGMAVDDNPWNHLFTNMSGMVLSHTGTSAAVVQVSPMAAADVEGFKKGLFSLAVDGNLLDKTFLNIWDITFDPTGQNLAAAVRLTREAYTIVQNDTLWDKRFQAVWNPRFSNSGTVLAPVRDGGKWKLFQDNEPFWEKGYDQLWKITPSPANSDIAAIVSPAFGKWSVAVNDRVWNMSCDTMISDIFYSDNGSCLVALLKNKGVWNLAKNQTLWDLSADKLFTPCISFDGSFVAVVMEKLGKHHLIVNNKTIVTNYDLISSPVFSPDLSKILVKGIENGIYKRRVLSI